MSFLPSAHTILIIARALPEDSDPISLIPDIQVPRKQKIEPDHIHQNGNGAVTPPTAAGKRKRTGSLEEPTIEGRQPIKRGKVQDAPEVDDVILVDSSSNGAIVIDD